MAIIFSPLIAIRHSSTVFAVSRVFNNYVLMVHIFNIPWTARRCAARITVIMMGRSIPAYVCETCGKGFASSRSARRHVRTVEGGVGQVFTEAQYRIMLGTGIIVPPLAKLSPPSFKRAVRDPLEIAKEEFMRGLYRKLGEKAAGDLPPQLAKQLISFLMLETQLEFFKASQKNPTV